MTLRYALSIVAIFGIGVVLFQQGTTGPSLVGLVIGFGAGVFGWEAHAFERHSDRTQAQRVFKLVVVVILAGTAGVVTADLPHGTIASVLIGHAIGAVTAWFVYR